MKDIGIITIFYNNFNAGGLLQAYALQKITRELGYSSEVISYDRYAVDFSNDSKLCNLLRKVCRLPHKVKNKIYFNKLDKRKKSFIEFMEMIPHSRVVYDASNIYKANDEYKGFICGSDQIWNPDFYTPVDFLSFSKGNFKISYAASVGVSCLDKDVEDKYVSYLSDFSGISVRERNAAELLKRAGKIDYVIDPTMLVDKEEWSKLVGARVIQKKFAFVYFLGDSKAQRKWVENYSKHNNIYTVTFRNVKLDYRSVDKNFCDQDIEEGGPLEFIRCIRDSEMVITDSFHAIVFSIIFGKQFYIINRFTDFDSKSQNIRIFDLLDRFGIPDRQVNSIEKKINDIDYSIVEDKLEKQKQLSLDWLSKNLAYCLKDKDEK